MAKTAITEPIFIPHAGCPGRCVFCNQARSAGASDELSREAIVRKVALYRESAQESVSRFEIAFFGGNFTGLPAPEQARLLDIASGLKGAGAIQAIRCPTPRLHQRKNSLRTLRGRERA
jgi:histone acetyltransferase (RNA polymerase elongator complex component)